ncbi:hypothetical protein [Caldanaerobacter subterraneus]|uniref:Uncharacterized protein n=1 Tax=Caldanaerobacter subterraneus TaxID=911092 RepID=A0A4R2KDB2_9THEO|nr:hypothetical protein [Caldanaerobacter subterraneus]TCO68246.1 hypothetical protein EV203_103143 [Caldanaerobacter subterraneus]
MKVIDLIKVNKLEELVKSALAEWSDKTFVPLFFVINSNGQLKEEYRNFYNMLQKLEPDKDIKGRIIIDPLLGDITSTQNSKNERLEFLSWEEVLALEVDLKDFDNWYLLYFIDELLYLVTMHGRAFDVETKRRIEYEEKIKQSLVPKITSAKEKFLYFLKDVLDFSTSPEGVLLLTPLMLVLLMTITAYKKLFAFLFAFLIGTDPHSLLIKTAVMIAFFVFFMVLRVFYVKLDSYLDGEFKRKFRQNIEQYLKEHPEASSFLNTERIESFDYVLKLK